VSSHERIESQYTVWEDEITSLTLFSFTLCDLRVGPGFFRWGAVKSDASVRGAIVPQLVPAGTVTRRAIEKTWLTGKTISKPFINSFFCSIESQNGPYWV
jgi:hypothetical protein